VLDIGGTVGHLDNFDQLSWIQSIVPQVAQICQMRFRLCGTLYPIQMGVELIVILSDGLRVELQGTSRCRVFSGLELKRFDSTRSQTMSFSR
jgi:hypothetical protein